MMGRQRWAALAGAILLTAGCGPGLTPEDSSSTGSSSTEVPSEASTSVQTSSTGGTSGRTGTAESSSGTSDSGSSVGSSGTTGTGTETGEIACEMSCAPPEFELAWRVDASALGSSLLADATSFEGVVVGGEAWIHAVRFVNGELAGAGVAVVDASGELRVEWTYEGLGLPNQGLGFAVGEDGFAFLNRTEEVGGPSDIFWYDQDGDLICELQRDAYVRDLLPQRDGGWITNSSGGRDAPVVRFSHACDPEPTELDTGRIPITQTYPFVLEWMDGAVVSAGHAGTIGVASWFIDVWTRRSQETWDKGGGFSGDLTMAGLTSDGRAVVAGHNTRSGEWVHSLLAVDPVSFTAQEWAPDPSHGTPRQLLSSPGGTWVLNDNPLTVSNLDGEGCCASPLDAKLGPVQRKSVGRIGDDFLVVERGGPIDAELVIWRFNAITN